MNSKVFLSYSYQDKQFADWLSHKLAISGINVWYDQNEIYAGESITEKINEGLETSSIFLIIISKNSLKSVWVNYELNSALIRAASNHGVRIVPIKIDEAELPLFLNSIKYADFRDNKDYSLKKLISEIMRIQKINYPVPNWNTINREDFENLVYELLLLEGFVATKVGRKKHELDFVARKKEEQDNTIIEKKWIIEAKFYRESKISLGQITELYGYTKIAEADYLLLITNSSLSKLAKEFISDKITDIKIHVWDEAYLVELLYKHSKLFKKYFNITPIPDNACVHIIDSKLEEIQNFIKKLEKCPAGFEGWKNYEDICIEIFNYLFVPPLSLPKIQSRRESGIDIRDALYPNRCENENWKFIRNDYDAKYILFEFKNFSLDGNEVDKEVVNQIRDYLKKTIGKFGIICSRKEPVRSALEKRKDSFIEDGKMIIFITSDHIKEMLMKKYRDEDPADVIMDLIDEFNLSF